MYIIYMNTAIINFTTDPKLKTEAQKVAKKLGIPLSLALNNYLRHLVQTKTVVFKSEEPSKYLLNKMRRSEKNYKEGKGSPVFENIEDDLKWLKKQGI